MSYQVLARKWRPRTFHELIGQSHVSRALINALDQDRLHHAYLFTGTRGVGKTTIARILAKCLNCEQGVSSTPCGQCDTCRAIDEGRFVDLIEVDAASRTKVEDTRELLDNVQYAPTQGRYKVYLIDEVHMLSSHSFNALLKTLEEPPPHVKFLLATTDPQKLPITVLSRCLQFALKAMSPENIVGHLEHILGQEGVTFESAALWLLARGASGSMRDALSLTDQAIAFGQGAIHEGDVASMLGTLDHRHLTAIAQSLAGVNAPALLKTVAELAEQSPDYSAVLDGLCELFHQLAVAQMVPDAIMSTQDQHLVVQLAQQFTAEDVQLYYQIALQGRQDMTSAPEPRSALEMTLLRMLAFRPQGVPAPAAVPLPMSGSAVSAPQSMPETVANSTSSVSTAAPQQPQATTAPVVNEPPWDMPEPMAAVEVASAPQTSVAPVSPSSDMNDYAAFESMQSESLSDMPAEVNSAAAKKPDVAVAPSADVSIAVTDTAVTTLPPDNAPLNHAAWLTLFAKLSLGGLTGNLVAHTVLEQDDGRTLHLRLDPSQGAMNAEVHAHRLSDALVQQGWQRQIQIEVGQLPEKVETPIVRRRRLQAERQTRAVEALRNDPHVQLFQTQFSARLLEDSVTSFEDKPSH